jgi:hypothetical protein
MAKEDKPVEVEAIPDASETVPEAPPVNPTKDTFSKAADWLRRLGKIKDDGAQDETRHSPTIGEAVAQARQEASTAPRIGEETMALPIFDSSFLPDGETPDRPSSRTQRRFVLKVAGGGQYTIGDIPGGIGSSEDHSSPEDGPWQWVCLAGEESVDPVHLFFGHENGVLWVSDQGSAFGTIVIEPGQAPISCEPHKRYFVIRGSEIRVGGLVVTLH